MSAPAREQLTVFIDGTERAGLIVYALRSAGSHPDIEFATDVWPESELRSFRLHGDAWEILRWDVALDRWPRGRLWPEILRLTLQRLVEGGAVVAWVGAEGLPFADPPDLFSAELMTGSVLAALTSAGEFMCPMDPDLPIKALSDEELTRLRDHARPLADAPA